MSKAQVREEKDYSNKVIDADSLLFLADFMTVWKKYLMMKN